MNIGKGLTKSKIITIVIIALVVIALIVTLIFALKGCQNEDLPVQGDGTSQTDPSGDDSSTTDPTDDTSSTTDPTDTSEPTVTTFTVTFKDYDGTVLGTQKVEKGKAATAPANPVRENFTFAGWDKKFDKITSDLVVTATYTTTKALIYVESTTVNKGTSEVTVNIRVKNNPGIMGAVLKVSVDDKMFSFKSGTSTGYPGLTLTSPGSATTSSPYTFMLDALELSADDKKDGTLFSITFKVKDTSATGDYKVSLSYDDGAIFDENYNDPNVILGSGIITIN